MISVPSLKEKFGDDAKARTALCVYLNRLRTSHTLEEVASDFNLSVRTIRRRIEDVRACLLNEFVPQHLYYRSRDDLINHTTIVSKQLYGNGRDMVALVWDGTYIYINKSGNFEFQKDTFSVHKMRNLMKIMMCVTTDGTIAAVYGPYPAGQNDASILSEIIREQPEIFEALDFADAMVVDRGFRDVAQELRDLGYIVKIPSFLKPNQKQLPIDESNETRLVTKTRFIVEVRNSHMKRIWKYFDGENRTNMCPFLISDFKIAAALLNAFFPVIITDGAMHNDVGNLMLERVKVPNILYMVVDKIPKNMFEELNADDLEKFPRLSTEQLKMISLGTYQISKAVHYAQFHFKKNDKTFRVFKCKDCQEYFSQYFVPGRDPVLLLIQIPSRFVSRAHHNTYVLFDRNGVGIKAVIAYSCDCLIGLRTVGCCSHVMALIWFICFVDRQSIENIFPARFLDHIFHPVDEIHSDRDSSEEEDNN